MKPEENLEELGTRSRKRQGRLSHFVKEALGIDEPESRDSVAKNHIRVEGGLLVLPISVGYMNRGLSRAEMFI